MRKIILSVALVAVTLVGFMPATVNAAEHRRGRFDEHRRVEEHRLGWHWVHHHGWVRDCR